MRRTSPEFRRQQLRGNKNTELLSSASAQNASSAWTESKSKPTAPTTEQLEVTVTTTKTPYEIMQDSPERKGRGLKNLHSRTAKKDDKFRSSRKFDDTKSMKAKPKRRLIFNIHNTQYPVIDLAARNLGFKTVTKDHNLVPCAEVRQAHKTAFGPYAAIQPDEFDLVWFDCAIGPEALTKLKPHQRISQWPGISVLSHKDRMAKNLLVMRSHFPSEYDFFPTTYMLPADTAEFKKEFRKAQPATFIVKPSHDCQGRGIYLMNEFSQLADSEREVVAQTYIDDPFLIGNLKFDLRLYILLYGINPLKIYLFDDGLARFATNKYVSAKESDLKDLFMHLTNYSINKNSAAFVQNQNQDGSTTEARPSHKRSLKDIYKVLESAGHNTSKLKQDIKDLVVKTVITGQNYLNHMFRQCQPDDSENQMCFQILGFDVMLDSKLKPWLIEINQSPSFGTDSAFDFSLKSRLVEDTFALLNLTPERKAVYMEEKEKQYFIRMLGQSKHAKPTWEEKEAKRAAIDEERDRAEEPILEGSGYERIFPITNDDAKMQRYKSFLKLARDQQDQFTHGKVKLKAEYNAYDAALESQSKLIESLKAEERAKAIASKRPGSKQRRASQMKFRTPDKTAKVDILANQKLEEQKLKERIQKAALIQKAKRRELEAERQLNRSDTVVELIPAKIVEEIAITPPKINPIAPKLSNQRGEKQTKSEVPFRTSPFQDQKAQSEVSLLKSSAMQKEGNSVAKVPLTKITQMKTVNPKPDFVNPYTNFLRSREQLMAEREVRQSVPVLAAAFEINNQGVSKSCADFQIKSDDKKNNPGKQPFEARKASERAKATIKDMVVTPVLESRKIKAAAGDTQPGKSGGSRNDRPQALSLSVNPSSQTQILDFNKEAEKNKNESITNIAAKNLYLQKANYSNKQKNEESDESASDDQDTAKPEESEPFGRGLNGQASKSKYLPLNKRKRGQSQTRLLDRKKAAEAGLPQLTLQTETPVESSMTPHVERPKTKVLEFKTPPPQRKDPGFIRKEIPKATHQLLVAEEVPRPEVLSPTRVQQVGFSYISTQIGKEKESVEKYVEQRKAILEQRSAKQAKEVTVPTPMPTKLEFAPFEMAEAVSLGPDETEGSGEVGDGELQNERSPSQNETIHEDHKDELRNAESSRLSMTPSAISNSEAENVYLGKWKQELETTHFVVNYQIMPKKLEKEITPRVVIKQHAINFWNPPKAEFSPQRKERQHDPPVGQLTATKYEENKAEKLEREASPSPVRIRVTKKQTEEIIPTFKAPTLQKITEIQRNEDLLMRTKSSFKASEPKKQQEMPRQVFSAVKQSRQLFSPIKQPSAKEPETVAIKAKAVSNRQSNHHNPRLSVNNYMQQTAIQQSAKMNEAVTLYAFAPAKKQEVKQEVIQSKTTPRNTEETKKAKKHMKQKSTIKERRTSHQVSDDSSVQEEQKAAPKKALEKKPTKDAKADPVKRVEPSNFLYKKPVDAAPEVTATTQTHKSTKLNADLLSSPVSPEVLAPVKTKKQTAQQIQLGQLTPETKKEKKKKDDPLLSAEKELKKAKEANGIRMSQKQIEARETFLSLIEELKASGMDPVFNLSTDFAMHHQIGHGMYAVIKKCTHRNTGYKLALKTYEKKQLTKKSQLMAIHREIYILAGMDHPNIMRLYEVIDTKTYVHLVMELCLGQTLNEFASEHGSPAKLPSGVVASFLHEKTAQHLFKQIVSAVAYMHSLELVHRDLKISQILVNAETQEVKFTDFGFATSFQQNGTLQVIGGTPNIENAQEIEKQTSSGQSEDVQQLGVILFTMMTGGAPSWSTQECDGFNTYEAQMHSFPVTEHPRTGQLYQAFSNDLQSLLRTLYQPNISSEQILKHPWLNIN